MGGRHLARLPATSATRVHGRPVTKPVMRVVRERIDPRLTASLFANYRSAMDALLELVDNAVVNSSATVSKAGL